MEASVALQKIDTVTMGICHVRKEARCQEFSQFVPVSLAVKTINPQTLLKVLHAETVMSFSESLFLKKNIVQGAKLEQGLFAMTTQTEKANHDFYQYVKQIEGISVLAYGGRTWNEKTIVVTVRDLFHESADQVFDLKSRIYDMYPSARLDVQVVESGTGL